MNQQVETESSGVLSLLMQVIGKVEPGETEA